MTRVKISIIIMAALTAVSIFSCLWVGRKCVILTAEAEAVSSAFEAGDTEKAKDSAEELSNDWEKFRSAAAVLLKYERLFEVDRIVSHLRPMIDHDEEEVLPQIDELIHMLDIIRRNEIPYPDSVF